MYHYVPGLSCICPWYVLGIYWYVLVQIRKNKKRTRKTFELEQWISCIASCALYHYATSVHSMVISIINTWYIAPETNTRITRYLLFGVGRRARVQPRPRLRPWRHWSGHRLEFPGYPFWLSKRQTLKAQFGCKTLLASGVQAGTDCRPSSGCTALSDSESARLGCGAALPLSWTMIYLAAGANLS
jgi:hypothetical protein